MLVKKVIKNLQAKKAWPTQKAMQQVYDKNLWGVGEGRFYSGEGSYCDKIVKPYLTAVANFLSSFETRLTVCDLGCGDFNVGKHLVQHTHKYIAIDIVPELISYNEQKFKDDRLTFLNLDISKELLPAGDCALIRQVLQHLSNREIQNCMPKLNAYRYVILTEHVPNGHFTPNIDIISGQGTRLKKHSGVRLQAAPFSVQVKSTKTLLVLPSPDGKGVIETSLLTMF